MRWTPLFACAAVLLAGCAIAQEEDQESPPEPPKPPPAFTEMQTPVRVSAIPSVPAGTAVWLRLADEVKVKKVKVGDSVNFVLYRDLYYRNWLLAKAGTPVSASIQTLEKAKVLNRGSRIEIVFHGLQLLNGQMLPLTGESTAKGGVGTGGHIAGGILHFVGECKGWPCVIFDVPALPAALALGVASKGENRNVKVDTSAPAFVSSDFQVDLASLARIEELSAATAKVTIVRGVLGSGYSRDLYCNGVPLAHMESKRKLELQLQPGYYRFSIDPKKGALELFVNGGSDLKLLADFRHIYVLNERDVDPNTNKIFGTRNAGQLLKQSEAVQSTHLFSTTCLPLAEEVVP